MVRLLGSQLRALQVRLLEPVLQCLEPQGWATMLTIPILVTTIVLPLPEGTIYRPLPQQDHLEHTKHTLVARCRLRFPLYHLMEPLLAHRSQEWFRDWMLELLEVESGV